MARDGYKDDVGGNEACGEGVGDRGVGGLGIGPAGQVRRGAGEGRRRADDHAIPWAGGAALPEVSVKVRNTVSPEVPSRWGLGVVTVMVWLAVSL